MPSIYSGVLKVLLSGVLAQFVQVALFPIVAVSYGTDSITKLGALLSFAALISPIVNIRLENLFLIVKEKYIARLVVFNLYVATVVGSLVYFAFKFIFERNNSEWYEIVFALCILVFSNYSQSISNVLIRLGRYKEYTLGSLIRVFFSMALPIGLGTIIGFRYWLLLAAYAFASMFVSLYYCFSLKSYFSNIVALRIRFLRWIFLRYKKNFIFGVFHGLLNSAAHNLPIILFAIYFDPKFVGALIVLDRTFKSGVAVVNNSIRTVVTSSDVFNNKIKLKKIQLILFLLGGGGVLLSAGLVSNIIEIEWGEWSEIPKISIFVAIWGFGMVINPIGSALMIKFEDFISLTIAQFIDLISRIVLIFVSAYFFDSFYYALAGYVFCSLLYNFFIAINGWRLLKKHEPA